MVVSLDFMNIDRIIRLVNKHEITMVTVLNLRNRVYSIRAELC
jgi:hypothetical protein